MYDAIYMRFSSISGCDIPWIGPHAACNQIYVSAYLYNQLRFGGCTQHSILTTSLEFHLVHMCHGWLLSSGYANVMPKVLVPVLLLCILNLQSHAFKGWALAPDCHMHISLSNRICSQIYSVIWWFHRSVLRTIMNVVSWCQSQFVAIKIWCVSTNPITAACIVGAVIWQGITACGDTAWLYPNWQYWQTVWHFLHIVTFDSLDLFVILVHPFPPMVPHLSPSKKSIIFELHQNGTSNRKIAQRFNCHHTTISWIIVNMAICDTWMGLEIHSGWVNSLFNWVGAIFWACAWRCGGPEKPWSLLWCLHHLQGT